MKQEHEIEVGNVMRCATMRFRISGVRPFLFRVRVCTLLLRLVARIMGTGIKIEHEAASDTRPDLQGLVAQLEVQLAGCAVAAQGWNSGDNLAREGDYGWSPAYQDVLDLRRKYEAGEEG